MITGNKQSFVDGEGSLLSLTAAQPVSDTSGFWKGFETGSATAKPELPGRAEDRKAP